MYDTIREWPRYVKVPFPIAKVKQICCCCPFFPFPFLLGVGRVGDWRSLDNGFISTCFNGCSWSILVFVALDEFIFILLCTYLQFQYMNFCCLT